MLNKTVPFRQLSRSFRALFCRVIAVALLAITAPLLSAEARQMGDRSTAVVLDFENGTNGTLRKSVRKELASRFLDRLEAQQAFDKVLNEKQAKKGPHGDADSAVVVAGVITHYRKRTAIIRILVGVDEGISFFDTQIRLTPKSGSDGLRADVNEITMVEDTVVDQVRDKGETVKDYVEDAAQLIARAYRSEHRQNSKS